MALFFSSLAGEYIVEIGDAAECLFLVLADEVVCHRSGGDEELMRLKQGDFFGESCLKETDEERQRLANVVAVGKVRVGCLKSSDFKEVCGMRALAPHTASCQLLQPNCNATL